MLALRRTTLMALSALTLAGWWAAPTSASAASGGDPCALIRSARGPYIGGDPSDVASRQTVTIMGETRPVDLGRIDGTTLDWGDPSKNLWFRSLYWLASTAIYAHESNQPAVLDAMISAVEGYHSRTPDPGGEDLSRAGKTGWDEGTVTRRQEAVNCLYSIAPRPALAAILQQLSAANLDDQRYLGPPRQPPHNHGLMANQTLWTTGELLGDTSLVNRAVARLTRDFQRSFYSRGVTIEGSTVYQFFLYPEWQRVAARLRESGDTNTADAMDRKLATVWQAALHMIAPNGDVNRIGDGFPQPLFPQIDPRTPLRLRDPNALFAARFSWTDPSSPYVALRVGKTRGAHGHDDLGSLTWFAGGRWVLSDAGSYNYSSTPVNQWLETRAAHNVPSNTVQPSSNGKSGYVAKLGRNSQSPSVGSVSARLIVPGTPSSRIDRSVKYTRSGRLTVADQGPAISVQRFTIDPAFTQTKLAANGRTALFRTGEGRTLSVTAANGNRLSTVRGREKPRAGWIAPSWETLVPATMVQNQGERRGQELRVTFVLR